MSSSFTSKYAEGVLRFRWAVIGLTVFLTMASVYGVRFLEFTTDYRVFFHESNPQLQAFDALQNTYDKSDNVMFIISPKNGETVFTKQTLESIEWLTNEAWQIPYSTRVDSLTNYQHTTVDNDDLMVADLAKDSATLSVQALEEIKKIAVNEPLLVSRLVNSEGTVTGVNVTVQLPGENIKEVPEVAEFVRGLASSMEEKFDHVEVRMTGIVMMNNAFGEASETDMVTLLPLMFLVVIVMLGFMLRSFSATIVSVFVIFFTIFVSMGLFGWSGNKMTAPVASAPVIILTMAVADSVHILVTFLGEMRKGFDKFKAMIESIRVNAMPVFLTSLTTVIGFLSMNFSEVPPLGHLGTLVAVGVTIAYMLSMTFLPAATVLFPFKQGVVEKKQSEYFEKLGNLVVDKRKPLMWCMLALSIVLAAFLPQNEINDEFVKYFDERVDFRVDTDYASENLVGPYTIEFSFNSLESGGISDPEYLAKVNEFVEHLKSYPEVVHVFTLTDTMKRLNKNMHGDDPDEHRLPQERELAAQYLLLYEMSLPYGLDLNNQIDVDKSATRITMSTINLSSNQVLSLEQSINQWIADHALNYSVDAASANLMFAHIGNRNAHSLMFGTTLALFAISIILIFALRSLKMGIISLLPNLVPVGIAFGIWGIIDGQIGMSVSIVAGMTLGIVVDDTVHFLSKYLRARREKNLDAKEATKYAFINVGPALFVTTVVLVIGFLVLTLSTFKMNADMGLVTAITIAVALIIDFLLLPPVLIALDKNKASVDETVPANAPLAAD